MALCLGNYGDPKEVKISYERGTPEKRPQSSKGEITGVAILTLEISQLVFRNHL